MARKAVNIYSRLVINLLFTLLEPACWIVFTFGLGLRRIIQKTIEGSLWMA